VRYGTIAVAGLLVAMSAGGAQSSKPVRLEVRPFVGRYVPAGTQGQDFKQASTFGLQGALELSSYIHVLASLGQTNSHSKIGALIVDQTRMLQYDLGMEVNGMRELGPRYLLRPFVGVGAGARSYSYKEPGITTSTSAAGYGAVGSELQRGSVAVRLEARSYVSRFNTPLTTEEHFRNDMSFMFGLAYHIF
jgi:hypothetical protein